MAGPVFDSAGTGVNSAGTTTLNVPYPATVTANNLLVLQMDLRDSGHTITTPAGWDVIKALFDNGFTINVAVYAKVATGSESGNLGVTIGGGASPAMGRIYQFSGNQTTAGYTEGLSNAGVGDASSTVTDAGVTTTGADRLAVNLVAISGVGAMTSFTGETGGDWTEAIAEFSDASNGGIQLQTAAMASAGTINGGTFTQDGGQYLVVGFAILPGTPATPQNQIAWIVA